MPTYAFTIAGASKPFKEGWSIRETINGRNTLSFETTSPNGSYRPALLAEVLVTEDAVRIFGGNIERAPERSLAGIGGTALTTSVSAVDFNALADRRILSEVIIGGTLKAGLLFLEPFLAIYGVSLDAAQATGPTLPPVTVNYTRLDKVLDQLSELSGYVWEIDYDKTLRMFEPGSAAAPFNIVDGDGNAVGEIEVEPSRVDYATRLFVLGGTGTRNVDWTRFAGNGTVRAWALRIFPSSLVGAEVRVSFAGETPAGTYAVGTYGVDSTIWTYELATNTLHQSTAQTVIGALGYVEIKYVGWFPYAAFEDDGGPDSLLVETTVSYPDIFDPDVIDALAVSLFPKYQAQPRTVRYTTRRTGLKPGRTQVLTIPAHNITAVTFLITDIETRSITFGVVERVVTLTEGVVMVGSWRDVFKDWSGGGGGGSSAASVIVGTGGPVATSGYAFLGGSRNTAPTLAVAAYTPVPDYVPFVAKTSFSGRVRADIWARDSGIGATVRLRNTTDSTTAGTSSTVTSQTPTEVTFNVSIVAGKTYRLEVLSSTNAKGVFAIGSLESI